TAAFGPRPKDRYWRSIAQHVEVSKAAPERRHNFGAEVASRNRDRLPHISVLTLVCVSLGSRMHHFNRCCFRRTRSAILWKQAKFLQCERAGLLGATGSPAVRACTVKLPA